MQIKNNILIGFTLLTATFGISNQTKAAPATIKTAAITISSPKNNAQVSSPITISGKATAGQQVKVSVEAVYDGGRQNITNVNVIPVKNGVWKTRSIALQLPEGAKNGRFEITASQTINRRIQKSRTVTVKLKQMNIAQVKPEIKQIPKKPTLTPYPPSGSSLAPVITSPVKNTSVSSPLTVQGTATRTVRGTNEDVTVTIRSTFTGGSVLLKQYTLTLDNNNRWHTPATELWLPYGAKNAKFEITATQTIELVKRTTKVIVNPSSNVSYQLAKPTITSPSRDSRVALPKTINIQGTGIPGHNIDVSVRGYWGSIHGNGNREAGHGSAVVGSNGTWTARIAVEQVVPAGDVYRENYYKISAKQAFPDNKFSATVTSTFHSTGN